LAEVEVEAEAEAEADAENLARDHVALVQNRHGANRKVLHLPNPVRAPSASGHLKTASVDPIACFPPDQNDTF
jgi:hypothetical protein